MRLVMFGTGPFAAPTFRVLLDSSHDVAALITQPVRPARGKPSQAGTSTSPTRELAAARGVRILDPEDVNAAEARAEVAALGAELFVVADYGQILSADLLAATRLGGVNLHGSLLPQYRGAAPINWAIYHGETQTGVSVIQMTPRIDAGPVLAQAALAIHPEENAVELETRLAELGAPLVLRVIDELAAGRVAALPQDVSRASPARRLRKTDGAIDWSRPAVAIKNQVRALEPWPKSYTFWRRGSGEGDKAPLRLIIARCAVGPGAAGGSADPSLALRASVAPGTVLEARGDSLVVAAGEGAVAILGIQPAGKRVLTTAEFLRGYPVRPGDTFGPE